MRLDANTYNRRLKGFGMDAENVVEASQPQISNHSNNEYDVYLNNRRGFMHIDYSVPTSLQPIFRKICNIIFNK